MLCMSNLLFPRLCSLLLVSAAPLALGEEDADHSEECGHDHGPACDAGLPPAFGCDLTGHWLDPWSHAHFSRTGAPFIHNFGFEPAYLGRDLFITYGWAELDEGTEQEIEIEFEWAFTRRLGIAIEQPYVFGDPDGESSIDGFGDLAIVPRFLLCEHDCFMASLNVEIEVPTGDDNVGAGEEWHLAPFISTWSDLGNSWALTSASGFEFALESQETEFFFAVGLSKAIRIHEPHLFCPEPEDAHGNNLPTGILSLLAEVYGGVVIDGEEEGEWAFEALIGLNYSLNSVFDLRAGYVFPLNDHSELDQGTKVGVIHHF